MVELNCLLTLYLALAPVGVPSHSLQENLHGVCATREISIHIVDPGILKITNNYQEYQIPLPRRIDHAWLTYRLGDEFAYVGNCASEYYPYNDAFCGRIMTRISAIGWQ